MRVDVKKFLFVGVQKNLDQFLEAVQLSGKVQFVMKPKPIADLIGVEVYDIIRAMKILAHYADSDPNIAQKHSTIRRTITNPLSFSHEILKLHEELDTIDSELKVLSSKHALCQFFGTVPWDDISFIETRSSCHVRFFEGATRRHFDKAIPELVPLYENAERTYFISFHFSLNHLPSGLHEIPREDLTEFATRKKSLLDRRYTVDHQLKLMSRDLQGLKDAFIHATNKARLYESKKTHNTAIGDTLFTMTGWLPETAIHEVSHLTSQYNVIAEEIVPEDEEVAPTYLENKGWSRVGEDLVHIYDTPSQTDSDPSWWVLSFFALFFAIIVGDAGYGFVFLAIALYCRKKTTISALGKRVTSLLALLGTSCIIWGLLFHSFFGISFSDENPIKKASLLTYVLEKRAEYHLKNGATDPEIIKWTETHNGRAPETAQDFLSTPDVKGDIPVDHYSDNVLFEAALFIGVIHIVLGMMRYTSRNYTYIGWIFFIIGAYLYMPGYLDATSFSSYLFGIEPGTANELGKQFMLFGAGFALVYAIMKHGIMGIFECMVAVQLFADTLSYLRLYALGLAGALVAKIINQNAATMPFIFAVILIIFSHAINIVLATVGGVIHGLRLNFLEWYHYSFEGGGKQFTPLQLEEKK